MDGAVVAGGGKCEQRVIEIIGNRMIFTMDYLHSLSARTVSFPSVVDSRF